MVSSLPPARPYIAGRDQDCRAGAGGAAEALRRRNVDAGHGAGGTQRRTCAAVCAPAPNVRRVCLDGIPASRRWMSRASPVAISVLARSRCSAFQRGVRTMTPRAAPGPGGGRCDAMPDRHAAPTSRSASYAHTMNVSNNACSPVHVGSRARGRLPLENVASFGHSSQDEDD